MVSKKLCNTKFSFKMILLLYLTLPIILIYYLLHKTRKPAKSLIPPPGPPRLPLIGNLHQIAAAKNLHIYLFQLSKKYGPIIHMKLGSTPVVVISSANFAKEVLKTQDHSFCSRPKIVSLQKVCYNYTDIVFSPYNEHWREMRKITSIHLFSLKKVRSFRPIREHEVSLMIAKISSYHNQVVDFSEMAMALSTSLICRIGFGKKYDEHGSEMRRFSQLLHEAQAMTMSFFFSDYFPALSWMDNFTGMNKKADAVFKNLDLFYQELIDDHLESNRVKEMDEEEDILDVLIQLKQQQNSSSPIEFTWDNIKAVLMNIFVAGTDTSASAIVWTMTALIKAPNIMEKLQQEIRSLVGQKGKVDEDDLPQLPYLKAVVSESLRMYPPGPLLIPRETMETCILNGYEILPKTTVYVNAYAVGRDPDYWENPDEFVPERFLNSNIDVRGQDFGVIPFGSGRRMCPGLPMGLLNVELTIANLLYSFDWKLPNGIRAEDVDTEPAPGLAVLKKNALMLVPVKYI